MDTCQPGLPLVQTWANTLTLASPITSLPICPTLAWSQFKFYLRGLLIGGGSKKALKEPAFFPPPHNHQQIPLPRSFMNKTNITSILYKVLPICSCKTSPSSLMTILSPRYIKFWHLCLPGFPPSPPKVRLQWGCPTQVTDLEGHFSVPLRFKTRALQHLQPNVPPSSPRPPPHPRRLTLSERAGRQESSALPNSHSYPMLFSKWPS